uniref:Uncharacterized protein n=1 Tax=Scophthalmus maximus TaxID=52904 RepID=A0A8D3DLE4_SCOMX
PLGDIWSAGAHLKPSTRCLSGAERAGDGEFHKPDLITYIVMCLLLFLLVLLIVFFINCQLRNSFFASMPYDRSLREARTSYNQGLGQMLPTRPPKRHSISPGYAGGLSEDERCAYGPAGGGNISTTPE